MNFGVLGDSSVDAYRGTDNRGGAYAAFTLNAVELLHRLRPTDFDLGAWGSYAEPRRTDYARNWARSGAEIPDLVDQGQTAGLVAQAGAGQVDCAYIRIGTNDFSYYGTLFGPIYSGSLAGSALTTELEDRADIILDAVDDLLTAGVDYIAVRGVPYRGDAAAAANGYPVEAQRNRVRDAVIAINAYLLPLLAQRGVASYDTYAQDQNPFMETHGGHLGVWMGPDFVVVDEGGDEPHHGVLSDNLHPGTLACSIEANDIIIKPLNATYGLGLRPLNWSEAWIAAGVYDNGIYGRLERAA